MRSKMADEVVLDMGAREKPQSLMEKFRERYNDQEVDKRIKLSSQRWVRGLMIFQAPTQLFMFHYYIIPYLFEDYDEWTQYYLKVFVTYTAIQCVINYLCTILYDTSITNTKDRPDLPGLTDRWENPPDHFVPLYNNQNGGAVQMQMPEEDDESGFEWKYCEICKIYKPPRTHHCNLCKVCILKRDHHCYMVGNCIGFKNQRYFVVLAFYVALIGLLSGYFQYRYLQVFYYPDSSSWTDFIPPVAFYRWLFGTVDTLSLHVCIMILHVYLEFLFGFIGFIYFNSQLAIISKGKTLYEMTKFIPVRNLNSINRNFRSVFGDFWALNFFFPMQLIFRQRDDGKSWEGIKLDHNANLQAKTN
ncbi:probable protein S-acyltransferase 6 isoform X1 [Pecten maximus]|uniref:probable protein S-acyltransferase 6 isoform X1 n=2 Tax=Pecten maximus TaxID=6579 RepID=UPI00145850ED|nr:probable protein S-acyltransferase 6 isoform X1 [Pecten maximus]